MTTSIENKKIDINLEETADCCYEEPFCKCKGCKNFALNISEKYPKLKAFLENLSLNIACPDEISWGNFAGGELSCQAVEYTFVGKVLEDDGKEIIIRDSTDLTVLLEKDEETEEGSGEFFITLKVFGLKLPYTLGKKPPKKEALKSKCMLDFNSRSEFSSLRQIVFKHKAVFLIISALFTLAGGGLAVWQLLNSGPMEEDLFELGMIAFFCGAAVLTYLIFAFHYDKKEKEKHLENVPFVPVRAENPNAGKVLLSANINGYDICYRRLKFTNQLIVNGFIYDEKKGVVEFTHSLTAYIDGHKIEAGLDELGLSGFSYISFDEKIIAEKDRRI